MASFFEDSSKALTEIRNDLICQICEGRATPGKSHWYRCKKLHLVCQDCKNSNGKCSCGKSILQDYCKIIEKLMNVGLKFNCTNDGCQELLLESALKDHESECDHRLMQCPRILTNNGKATEIKLCKNPVVFKDIFEHYKDHGFMSKGTHPIKKSVTLTPPATIKYLSEAVEFEYDKKSFIYESLRNEENLYFWVYFFGPASEAKNYSFELKFFGAKTSNVFNGQVVPIDEFLTFVNDGKCFTMSGLVFVAQFVNEDRQFEYSLEVKNLKTEIKDENCESGISDDDTE